MNAKVWTPLAAILVACLLVAGAARGEPKARRDEIKEALELHDLPVSSAANVATASLAPSLETVAYRITIALVGTDSVVDVQINPTGTGTTREYRLNSGTELAAGDLYTFTCGATDGATFNLQCETLTTIGYLLVEEILGGEL